MHLTTASRILQVRRNDLASAILAHVGASKLTHSGATPLQAIVGRIKRWDHRAASDSWKDSRADDEVRDAIVKMTADNLKIIREIDDPRRTLFC